jgi:hypothetical protein
VDGSIRKVMLMVAGDGEDLPGPLEPAARQPTVPEVTGYIVGRLFSVGLSLESARSIVGAGPARDRIAAATGEVDRLIRDIRAILYSSAADPLAAARERSARTARELQARALDAAALLEREAERARQPSRLDYRAEIKRWRAFADQAERMARQWEQPP